MTRINANIAPQLLSDHHLRAETREILRIPKYVASHIYENRPSVIEIPDKFTLGDGHIKFFVDKGYFIKDRYLSLFTEMNNRKLFLPFHSAPFEVYNDYPKFFGKWKGSPSYYNYFVVERIIDKMLANLRLRSTYRLSYYGTPEPPEETIKRLLKSLL